MAWSTRRTVEFADDSFGAATTAQGPIEKHPNLVILHTLSKAFGAARRASADMIAAPEVIDVFAAIRQIYSVSVLSQGGACLRACPRCVRAGGGPGRIRARARAVCALRARAAANGLPIEAWPSAATLCLCARRMPRVCASVCATSIRFWCATLAMRRGSRTVCASPWVRQRRMTRC